MNKLILNNKWTQTKLQIMYNSLWTTDEWIIIELQFMSMMVILINIGVCDTQWVSN